MPPERLDILGRIEPGLAVIASHVAGVEVLPAWPRLGPVRLCR
jgi:hypothetical protein